MARTQPTLKVYANPWHAPLDQNERANTACPVDPKDNKSRAFVGAHHKLDEDGDLYWEFTQYEGTHGAAHALHAAAVKGLALAEDAAKPEGAKAIDASRKALEALPPDSLVLRAGHAPITLPPTLYYKQQIRNGTLWAADMATHRTAFGSDDHFLPIADRAALAPVHRAQAHKAKHLEEADPKPRPAVGAGRMGLPESARPLSAVIANPKGDPELAKAALAETIKRIQAEALKQASGEGKPPGPSTQTSAVTAHSEET